MGSRSISSLYDNFKIPEPVIILSNEENKDNFNNYIHSFYSYDSKIDSVTNRFFKSMLENSIANINHFEFKTDNEIKNILQSILNCFKFTNEIYIYDRDFKLEQNDNTDFFLNIRTKYIFTKIEDQGHNCCNLKARIKSIQKKHKGVYNVFVSKKENIHERRLIISNLILESNHDFSMIKKSNSTWVITVSIDSEKSSKHKEKNHLFSKIPVP